MMCLAFDNIDEGETMAPFFIDATQGVGRPFLEKGAQISPVPSFDQKDFARARFKRKTIEHPMGETKRPRGGAA